MEGRAEIRLGLSRLHYPVLALGPGRRIGIWFQGCSIRCPGCMARDTWDPADPSDRVPLEAVTDWVAALPCRDVDGITISGGEPFDQPEALGALTWALRERFDPQAVDILVYTGYSYTGAVNRQPDVLETVDALVTEPYRRHANGTQLRWRGSPNQQLVALSDLARKRYAEHGDAIADTGLQIDAEGGGLRLIGVPRPGDLERIEQGLATRGVTLQDCSWNA